MYVFTNPSVLAGCDTRIIIKPILTALNCEIFFL